METCLNFSPTIVRRIIYQKIYFIRCLVVSRSLFSYVPWTRGRRTILFSYAKYGTQYKVILWFIIIKPLFFIFFSYHNVVNTINQSRRYSRFFLHNWPGCRGFFSDKWKSRILFRRSLVWGAREMSALLINPPLLVINIIIIRVTFRLLILQGTG